MRKQLIATPLVGSALLSISFSLHAEGLVETITGTNINESQVLKDWGIEVGGWADAGITYASHNSDSHNNAPIAFTDRNSDFMLNQVNLYIEKAVNTEGSGWDIGGRVDFMFGTDADNTQATGWDNRIMDQEFNSYDVAFPQAYMEIYAPLGNGLTAKLGHFYTNIGYEVVTAPDNFFYSHAYTMNYGEPFTHSGALFTYQVTDNIYVSGGAVTGWDNFRENGGDWSFLGGAGWTSDDAKTSVALSVISGENGDDSVSQNTTMYSIVLSHDITDQLHYVFQHDFGVIEDGTAPGDDADWYGINQYLMYDINDQLSAGVRGEWFSDNGKGIYTVNDTSVRGNYYAVTAGLNYSPLGWLKFRPEVRYDWVDTNGRGGPYNDGAETDQIEFSVDMIVTF